MRIFVRGLGFHTCVGNSREAVADSARAGRSGISICAEFDRPDVPVRLAGTVAGFEFPGHDPEDWVWPSEYPLPPKYLRPMSPAAIYGYCSARVALDDAGWGEETTRDLGTGLCCASSGSARLLHHHLHTLKERGPEHCHPLGIVRSIAGSLNFNLGAALGIRGGTLGFSTACASSSHAIGYAVDQIRLGRWQRAVVVGAEEVGFYATLPFAAMRALSLGADPRQYPRPFDRKRDGFVASGGATAMVLEGHDTPPAGSYAEITGWGESSDGFNVMAPEPEGAGLAECMKRALADARATPGDIDYINAHATGTTVGDTAELRAIRAVFGPGGHIPEVSSTKSITGHGLSLAGVLEAGISCLALRHGFVPPNTKLDQPDPEAEGIPLPICPQDRELNTVLSNSSGFGGSNVSIVLGRV